MSPHRQEPTREQLAVCAHDLRGALTVIIGYVELLRRSDLDADQRLKALDGIEAAVTRADALLDETLAGRTPSTRSVEPVPMATLAATAAADARAHSGREVNLHVIGRPIALGDRIAFERVLQNLLSNAVKYAPDGDIDVTVTCAEQRVVLEVADRGPGIPQQEHQRVLEPFTRLERDEALPGSGLGLTAVRSLAEQLAGEFTIADREGGGAIFRLVVPSAR